MKKAILPSVAGLLLALSPLAAAQTTTVTPTKDVRVMQSIDSLAAKARQNAADLNAVTEVGTLIVRWATPQEGEGEGMRERLNRCCTELQERARRTSVHYEDVMRLRERYVNARLERAVNQLSREARARTASRETFNHIHQLLIERARSAAAFDPNADTLRDRLRRSVNDMEDAARRQELTDITVRDFNERLVDARLDRAVADLERQSLSGRCMSDDFYRAFLLASARQAAAQLHRDQDSTVLRQRFESALREIEQRAISNSPTVTVTRADFDRLRADLAEFRSVISRKKMRDVAEAGAPVSR